MDKDKALEYEKFIMSKEKRRKSIEMDKDHSEKFKRHKIHGKHRNAKNISYEPDKYDDEYYNY